MEEGNKDKSEDAWGRENMIWYREWRIRLKRDKNDGVEEDGGMRRCVRVRVHC